MRQQAAMYGVDVTSGRVSKIFRDTQGFVAEADHRLIHARTVLLATGITNNRPEMTDEVHDTALARGSLRYCPVCDGYEVTDQRVAVIGTGRRGVKEARFLRSFTSDITLVSPEATHDLSADERGSMADMGITVIDGPISNIALTEHGLGFDSASGWLDFASVYPALGSQIHSGLGVGLEADCTDEGCIRVDTHQRSSTPGVYAAGDVVLGLDQISHAMGEAGVAATTIRNDLAAHTPLMRGGPR
jgi:thioredoxin reductase (NADPH)